MKSKFTLYSMSGKPLSYQIVKPTVVEAVSDGNSEAYTASHHIMVIDRSGSMWYDIDDLKSMILKVLTLSEYESSGQLISLISYSSSGSCTLHFERSRVSDIMKTGSVEQNAVKTIRAGGLTCGSQAMRMAQSLVRSDELTGITLHSDGYFNDRSPSAEHRETEAICNELSQGSVFVNTVSYSDYSDFQFLNKIANMVNGKCVKANDVRAVYDALSDTANTLANNSSPAITYELDGADYQVFFSRSQEKIYGSDEDLTVVGMGEDDDGVIFRYYEVDKSAYDAYNEDDEHGRAFILSYARSQLAEGNLSKAKYALFSFGCTTLTWEHYRALTNNDLARFAEGMEDILFGKDTRAHLWQTEPKPLSSGITVVEACSILEREREHILFDFEDLKENYTRRGLKKVAGKRNEDGGINPPWLEVEMTDTDKWVQMGTFDVNKSSATINLLVVRPCRLVKIESKEPISTVAGIKVNDLSSFNNYTVVGDGEVTVPHLSIRVSSEDSYIRLCRAGVIKEDPAGFDYTAPHQVTFKDMPVIDFEFDEMNAGSINDDYKNILYTKTLLKALDSMTKESSSEYTSEQIDELKRHYLSKQLYINFPMTNEYSDLQTALDNGTVDTSVRYKVTIGNTDIVNDSKLKSANAFLDRMYEAYNVETGEKISGKAKMDTYLDNAVGYREKQLSARTKVTASDLLQKQVFDEILGIDNSGDKVENILYLSGVNKSWSDIVSGGPKAIIEAKSTINKYLESLYSQNLVPLSFYIGATGLIPDCFNAKVETADEILKRLPDLALTKAEKEGSFFQIGDVIITVYAENVHVSIDREAVGSASEMANV